MQACGVLAALLIGLIVVLVCYDVIGRNLGLKSLPWIVEVTEYALPLITLLAAPWLLFRAEHVRLDLLSNTLPPAAVRTLDRITSAVGLAVSMVIVWYSLKVIADTREIGAMVMKSLMFPEWWLFVPVAAELRADGAGVRPPAAATRAALGGCLWLAALR